MKKLMFAAAAVAACVAVADVTSANIVGYQNQSFGQNEYNIAAASLLPVGMAREDMTLGDIVPDDSFYSSESQICFMTSKGANQKVDFKGKQVSASYIYWMADDDPGQGEGWYLVDDGNAEINQNATPVPFGTGFMVYRKASSAKLVHSGEVQKTPVYRVFDRNEYSIFGNCSPVKINLGDITPNDNFYSSESQICLMTNKGANKKVDFKGKQVSMSFIYWAADDDPGQGAGWYLVDDGNAEINYNELIQFEPAEGFYIYRKGSGSGLTVPAAIAE